MLSCSSKLLRYILYSSVVQWIDFHASSVVSALHYIVNFFSLISENYLSFLNFCGLVKKCSEKWWFLLYIISIIAQDTVAWIGRGSAWIFPAASQWCICVFHCGADLCHWFATASFLLSESWPFRPCHSNRPDSRQAYSKPGYEGSYWHVRWGKPLGWRLLMYSKFLIENCVRDCDISLNFVLLFIYSSLFLLCCWSLALQVCCA